MSDADDAIRPALRSGLTTLELARDLLGRIERGNAYARDRKQRFRRSSATVQLVSLALSGASTIILGLRTWTCGPVSGSPWWRSSPC